MDNSDVHDAVVATVEAEPGISFAEVLDCVDEATKADIYQLIVLGRIYTDLRMAWLGEPKKVSLFRDRNTAKFFHCLAETQVKDSKDCPQVDDLIPNTTFLLDGHSLEILLIGNTEITCYSKKNNLCPSFPISEFEKWMRNGKVTNFITRPKVDRESEAYRIAQTITGKDALIEALYKYNEIIKPYLSGKPITDTIYNPRTHRNLKARYKMAVIKWCNGLLGLVSQHHRKGNKTDRLELIHPQLRQKMNDFIDKEYEIVTYPTKSLAYGEFRNRCKEEGIKPPSYKTFILAIQDGAGAEQTEKMEGSKVAYQEEEFIDWDENIPIHGDRPWEYTHIDHTQIDIVLRHTDKGVVMGKAWLTLLIDSYSREVLAYYITYESPSQISCLGVLRECVRRHGRLPECIIADGGSEFRSIYFEQLLARYRCDIIWRPATKPRFGAVIERFIHTMNKQVIHNLCGNTKIMKKVRQVTDKVNPFKRVVWNLPMLEEALERYFYEEYPNKEHSGIGQTPRAAFINGIANSPRLEHLSVSYDDNFLINTLPSTKKGTAMLVRARGVKIFGIYYKSKKLRRPKLYGKQLEVRYDPWNMAHVYVWDGNEWILCLAPPRIYSWLKDRSVREIRTMTEEYRQTYRLYGKNFNVRVEQLAREHAQRKESESVEKQRLKDEELRTSAALRGKALSPVRDGGHIQAKSFADEKTNTLTGGPLKTEHLVTYKRAKSVGRRV